MGAADLLRHVRAAGFTLDLADGKLLVAPASMLTDELRTALRSSKTEVLALLTAEREADAEAFEERAAIMEFDGGLHRAEAEAAARQCVDCERFTRRRTCLEPVAAGLLTEEQGYGIAWPPSGHGAICPSFSSMASSRAVEQPCKLDQANGPAAHTHASAGGAIAPIQARAQRRAHLGFGTDESEGLAALLHMSVVDKARRMQDADV